MPPDRGSTATLAIVLLLAAVSRCPPGLALRARMPSACESHWVEVESNDGISTSVACATEDSRSGPPVGPARLLVGLPIEINLASAETLEVLPGIGPQRARAIVQERCHRPFEGLGDVARVRGIGPKTVEALREQAVAGPPTPDCPTAPTLPP